MNIYLITCPDADYDEYQAWVVIAASAEDALKLICNTRDREDGGPYSYGSLLPHPSNLTPERTTTELLGTSNETTSRIAYADFNAG